MKIKDLERTVNVAWSPASQYPILLATGTAAQQLDASFSTNATLELYSLNLSDPGMDMELKASTPSDNRFYKVVWGSYGIGGDKPSGVIVGGCDGGVIQMYNAAKLLSGEESLISRQEKHTGPVQSLDFNPFQPNLLASGAADSEIYIWDLNNTNTPMTPGSKSQPYETVQCLSWNRQVQHILATAFSTRCVVWDLRKNEPIIKLTDSSSHIRWKYVAWHPEVATQLCLASEEDQTPVIQLWDLRFATSPLKVLDNHQRGVMSIAWCDQDPDLLISCGKDNRILCWNPNSNLPRGEVLSEIAHTLQWNFDVAWCPRNPAVVAASSFDGHVAVYSLHGGRQAQLQTSNKIADSFPGMDGYVQAPAMQQQQAQVVSVDLAKSPKWLKRPAGASFAFGGRLITFENDKTIASQIQQAAQAGQVPPLINRTIIISQVITEPELIQKSSELEQTLQQGNFSDYCRQKADCSESQHERYVWYFLKANFDPNPKAELLNLLGYQPEDVSNKLRQFIKKPVTENNVNNLSDNLASLNRGDDYNATSAFDAIATDAKIAESVTQKLSTPFKISTGNDIDGLIAQAILLGNIEVAVELCLEANRMADALIIAMTGGSDLLARTQYRYLQESEGYVAALISALVSEDWSTIINQCNVESWKEALAAAITYSSNEELPVLCERLGERLENENSGNSKLLQDAQLCYICAGSFNKLVASWSSEVSSQNPVKLQELVELVTFMQKAIEQQGRVVEVSGNLADLLSHYAILLASQGSLNNALNYLGTSTDPQINELRERLYCNLGHKPAYAAAAQQQSSQARRVSNTRQPISGYNAQPNTYSQSSYSKFNTGLPNAAPVQQPWLGQNSMPAPVPAVPTVPVQSFGAPPSKPFSPGPPSQPPRPTSVGSAHGAPTKNKYIVDPSVQSNLPTQYGRSMYAPPGPMQPPVQPVPLLPASPSVKPYSAPFAPTSVAQNMINHQNFTNPIQSQPVPGSFPMQQPFPNVSSAAPMPFQPPPPGNVEMAQQAINAFPLSSSLPGWNDPPAVNKSIRPGAKPDFSQPAPITHPLFGAAPDSTPMNNGYSDTMSRPYGQAPPPGPMNPPPLQHAQQQQPMNNYNPQAMFAQHQVIQPAMQQQAPPQQQAAPPEPVKKGPVPEEHMYLQTVFDELKIQCTCAAINPQTKRKLEDVTRKLESLYDMLREQKLSANTLAALHQMVQLVQNGDYTGGLNLHTQLVSGPDFAQIASFMPGLKVLLQCALQLQVYLR